SRRLSRNLLSLLWFLWLRRPPRPTPFPYTTLFRSLGLFAGALSTPLEFAARSVVGRALPLELALWHGVTPPLLLSVATVALTLLLYWQRRGIRRFALPRGLNTARLYDGAVGVLDWISLRISRPLQDASLSPYVLDRK